MGWTNVNNPSDPFELEFRNLNNRIDELSNRLNEILDKDFGSSNKKICYYDGCEVCCFI